MNKVYATTQGNIIAITRTLDFNDNEIVEKAWNEHNNSDLYGE